MTDDIAQPRKRARGSYARLICFSCRARRIKCQLVDDGSIVPSSEPQPPEKACQRCRLQGLDCVVRKTTLGRPNQKKSRILTPSSTEPGAGQESRSPSPDAEDLVLLTLGERQSIRKEQTNSVHQLSSGVHMYGAVNRTFDLTSSLLGRDKRYGSAIAGLKDKIPKALESVISEDILPVLDHHLLWLRLYMPWLPSLSKLWSEISVAHPGSTNHLSASTLTALLATIALDVPSEQLAPYRKARLDLECIVYHLGQKLLFRLPRDEYTLVVFELVMNYRPLALIDSQEAAAHTLSGNLFGTLIHTMQQRLGLDTAPRRLRACLVSAQRSEVEDLVLRILRWCATTMWRISLDLEEVETNRSETYQPEVVLQDAFDIAAEAIHRHALDRCFFLFHVLRYHADDLIATREVTADWRDTSKLSSHIQAHVELRIQRRKDYDHGLLRFFFDQGRTEEGLALSQLITTEQGQGYSSVIGLAMFYAIMQGSQPFEGNSLDGGQHPMAQLSKFWTERVNHEAAIVALDGRTEASDFLEQYGEMHIEALEKRLTDFINAATDVSLQGVPFIGPPRHTSTNVLMACKEILENNAVRIKIDGYLHPRVDMQLILFENAARRLESMEADGGTPEAVAHGSVLTACAKLIRSLYRIMGQWKRSYAIEKASLQKQQQGCSNTQVANPPAGSMWPPFGPGIDDFLTDGLFTDWDAWAQFAPVDMSSLPFDAQNQ